MSNWKVSKEKIELFVHPNADALEIGKVGAYQVVVQKGLYQTGDEIIIPASIFGKPYNFKVVKVQSNNNGEPFCVLTSTTYIAKNVITFLNNLTVKRFNYDNITVTEERRNPKK